VGGKRTHDGIGQGTATTAGSYSSHRSRNVTPWTSSLSLLLQVSTITVRGQSAVAAMGRERYGARSRANCRQAPGGGTPGPPSGPPTTHPPDPPNAT